MPAGTRPPFGGPPVRQGINHRLPRTSPLALIGVGLAATGGMLLGAGLVDATTPVQQVGEVQSVLDPPALSPWALTQQEVVAWHATTATDPAKRAQSDASDAEGVAAPVPILILRAESAHLATVPIQELIAPGSRADLREDLAVMAATAQHRRLTPSFFGSCPCPMGAPTDHLDRISSDDRLARALVPVDRTPVVAATPDPRPGLRSRLPY